MGYSHVFYSSVIFKIFSTFFVFFIFFLLFQQKNSVALTGYGFARLEFVCPRTITSGLLYRDGTNSIKNYPQFSFFGGGHD
jgi:hypothetical protein